MSRRRFVPLAGLVAALTVALWLAPSGLALRKAVIQQLFGPKLVRLEALEKVPVGGSADWRIDRGVVTSASASQLTLREADGRVQSIPLSSSTRVLRLGRRVSPAVLTRGRRVLVTWPPIGPAQSVEVGRLPRIVVGRIAIQQLFGPQLVRLEVIERAPVGGSADWRIDRGLVTSVSGSQLTLREADGRVQTILLSSSTRVLRLGHRVALSALAPGWRVLVTWPASGAAQSVDVERVPFKRSRRLGQ
jgi:hypothetical protein